MNNSYDVIIIGGGIAGIGVAREAASRGLSVAVYEKDSCASAASDRSLRIVHGGFRYLQTLNLKRVIESIRDQSYWIKRCPDKLEWLPCLMPLKRFGFKSVIPITLGIIFYKILYRLLGFTPYKGACIYSRKKLEQELPALVKRCPYGALMWNDVLMTHTLDFSREVIKEAKDNGVVFVEDQKVTAVVKVKNKFSVQTESGEEKVAGVVINTAGAWFHRIEGLPEIPGKPEIKWCKAFNIILNKQIESVYATGLFSKTGRLFFLVPRKVEGRELSVLGTFYIPFNGDPDEVAVTQEEAAAMIKEYSEVWPEADITVDDIESIEAAVMPMRRIADDEPVLYGSEKIYDYSGYIEVLSTKYTTFRSQAITVMNKAKAYLN